MAGLHTTSIRVRLFIQGLRNGFSDWCSCRDIVYSYLVTCHAEVLLEPLYALPLLATMRPGDEIERRRSTNS